MREDLKNHTINMKTFLLSIVVIIIVSCNGHKKVAMKDSVEESSSTSDSLVLLVQDENSGSEIAETLVITNSKALGKFFAMVNKTRKPGISIPEIDFSKEMVIVHCSGRQSNGLLPVLSLLKETDTKVVIGSKTKHENEKRQSTAVTSPFSMYKMPLTKKEVVLEKGIE